MSAFSALTRRVNSGRVVRGALAMFGLMALLGGNLGAGCSTSGNVSSIDVPMEYKPRSADSPVLRTPTGTPLKIYVSPTVDNRSDPRTIGQNTEDETPIPVYAAGKTPADFVTEVLKQEMTTAGLEVISDVGGTQRQIDSELLQFKVTEDSNYQGMVQLRLKVVDATGKVLWQGVGNGDGNNYGKSKSAENYQQTFSDALRRAITKILADPKFLDAVSSAQ